MIKNILVFNITCILLSFDVKEKTAAQNEKKKHI